MDTTHLLRPAGLSGRAGHSRIDCLRARPRDTLAERPVAGTGAKARYPQTAGFASNESARPMMSARGLGALWLVALLAGCQAVTVPPASNPFAQASPAQLAVGDAWVYRISNGYNNEVRGQIRYQVEKVDAGRTVVSATPDDPYLGKPYTVAYTNEGNWLRHPMTNHDQPVEYEFAPAYPAYSFPLEPGKSWSTRVGAAHPATGKIISVRVDGTVLGAERIRVPAGEFDTIKIRRHVYAGDWDYFLHETHIIETDWYAPALGRPARTESKSEWRDWTRCAKGCPLMRGDWNVIEFAAATPAKR